MWASEDFQNLIWTSAVKRLGTSDVDIAQNLTISEWLHNFVQSYKHKLKVTNATQYTHTLTHTHTLLYPMAGGDDGRFQMDRQTGEVRLMQAVTDRLTNPTLHIRVMVRHAHKH